MEVPSALEDVAGVVRGFLPPHPVAKLVKELAFETNYDFFSDDEGDSSSGTYARGVRNSCWDCRRMMPQGVIGCIWDEQGEVAVDEAARQHFCPQCVEADLEESGFTRHRLEFCHSLDTWVVLWRDSRGVTWPQCIELDDLHRAMEAFRAATLGDPAAHR
jgi:hypothetical protein